MSYCMKSFAPFFKPCVLFSDHGLNESTSYISCFPATQDKLPVKQCDVSYVKVECYEDSSIENSSFPSLILKPILPLLNEGKTWSLRGEPWSKFLQNFVCSCAQRAKQLKYNYFGVKRFGESQLKS